jgi:putative peptidoglycan lipid II flippase
VRKAIIQLLTGNLASKALGLGREILTAALFGTGQAVGAFRIAQTGTLSPVNFFTSDTLNAAFIPQYRKFRDQTSEKAQTFFWSLLGIFGVLATLIGTALWVGAPPWVGVLAPGLEQDTASLAVDMLRIMALGVPAYLLSAILMFLGMANDDFVPMAIRPVMQNLGMIAGALMAVMLHDVVFLAWGFTASYVAFSAWVLLRSLRSGFMALPRAWYWPQVSEVMHAFWYTLRPLLLLPVMLQGNIIVERAVASLIGLAAISALDYARFVSETLILLISVPVAFAGLAHWSGLSGEMIRQRIQKVLMLMLVVAVPASAFLAAQAHVVVEAIYARGAFDAESVRVTGDILFGIALGLWAQVIGYVLIKALNAQMRNRAVVWVMAAALLANVAFNLTMYPYLDAMTLGFGNTAYGLILLGGALTALGLWKESFGAGGVMAIGAAGYLLLDHWLPQPEGGWASLAMAGGFAVTYWMAWIGLVPLMRHAVIEAVAPKWRKTG